MSIDSRTSASKHVWWTERDGIAIAKRSETDTSVDYVSPSEVKTITVHYNKLDQDFTANPSGSIDGFSDYTPLDDDSFWQIGVSWSNITQTSTSGSGSGLLVNITINVKGSPTFTIASGGSGYAVSDTIVFTDPGSTSNTVTITVSSLLSGIGLTNSSIIPEEFHEAIANYAIAKGYELKPELIKMSGYFRSLFNEDIREAKKYANKGRDGTAYTIMGTDF